MLRLAASSWEDGGVEALVGCRSALARKSSDSQPLTAGGDEAIRTPSSWSEREEDESERLSSPSELWRV